MVLELYVPIQKNISTSIQVDKHVTGRDLIGRDKEITTILHLLKAGQSVVVIAPGRFCKTSLMFEVLRKIKHEFEGTEFILGFAQKQMYEWRIENPDSDHGLFLHRKL
jgi:hypothetical protein